MLHIPSFYGANARKGVMTYTPPLDSVGSAAYAYGTRKLRSAYAGAAIQVQRSSDSTTTEIYFKDDGSINTTELLSFVGAGNGLITKWYDQSGNGRTLENPTSAKPFIVTAGVLETVNGYTCIRFAASTTLSTSNGTTLSSGFSNYHVFQVTQDYSTVAIMSKAGTVDIGCCTSNYIVAPMPFFTNYSQISIGSGATFNNFSFTEGLGYKAGKLYGPTHMWVDSYGNMFVCNSGMNTIEKYNSSGVYQFSITGVDTPTGVCTDSSGNIYVMEGNYSNPRLQKYDSSGTFDSETGAFGTGNGEFQLPKGLGIDSSDNIYVADSNNHRVQKFNSSLTYQSQFGTNGTGNGQFSYPSDVKVDSSGNIYVLDWLNYRIQKFNSSYTYQSKVGSYGTGNSQFLYPRTLSIDSSNNIYVTDTSNIRVTKFNSSLTYQSKFGSAGTGNGTFSDIIGVALDSSGNIYTTCNTVVSRIQKFNSSYTYQATYGNPVSDLNSYTMKIDSSTKSLESFKKLVANGTGTATYYSDLGGPLAVGTENSDAGGYGPGNSFVGKVVELICYPTKHSSGDTTTIVNNQVSYWGL